MNEHAEGIARAASTITYAASAGLIAGDWLQFLNQNAAACGVILGFLTFVTNFIFQLMNHRAIKSRIDNDDI